MNKLKGYADLPIRLTVGFHLIYGTIDNIFSWERMLEFSNFLEAYGMPLPLFSAIMSVYIQFTCGVFFFLGFKIRPASILMIVNFIVAILLVHVGDTYPSTYPAISMLAGSVFLMLNGAGKISLDVLINKKEQS
ncbi:DoxX family protein [Ekhidna sp.]